MFTMTYIRRELRRRWGRTLMTVLGLALGVGLVAGITSVSRGLDEAQAKVLDPLSSVGTDLMVTRPVELRGAKGPRDVSPEEMQQLASENQGVLTDLSKLGDPGDRFERDVFLPGTQLTFAEAEASKVAAVDGVEQVGKGLILTSIHQEGTIPDESVEVTVPGQTFAFRREVPKLSEKQQQEFDECVKRSDGRGPVARACLPNQVVEGEITTPDQTVRRRVGPIETDTEADTYTIGGVDLTADGIGLITQAQITEGRSFGSQGTKEAVVSESYAKRKGIDVGDKIKVDDASFTVVGLAKPPLGGQTADVYVELGRLQKISGREGRVNVLLVRADDAASVSTLDGTIEDTVNGARVTSAAEVASTVSGSLVDAASLSDKLGFVLAIVLLVSAFLFASLLTMSSVAKRVREIGTLKAIGWRKALIVRQIVGESLAQGMLGGIAGTALGVAAALAIVTLIPPLQASAASTGGGGPFSFGLGGREAASDVVQVRALIDATTVALAFGLALLGGLIAGVVGALRAARMRPADALRQVG